MIYFYFASFSRVQEVFGWLLCVVLAVLKETERRCKKHPLGHRLCSVVCTSKSSKTTRAFPHAAGETYQKQTEDHLVSPTSSEMPPKKHSNECRLTNSGLVPIAAPQIPTCPLSLLLMLCISAVNSVFKASKVSGGEIWGFVRAIKKYITSML